MLFLMEWKIKDGCAQKAVTKFLSTGAPLPNGSTLIGRYHAPGSVNGWLIVETEDPCLVYEHASEWGELLNWNTTPVLKDEDAGKVSKSVWMSEQCAGECAEKCAEKCAEECAEKCA